MKNERKNYVLPALSLISLAWDVMVNVGSGGASESEQLSKRHQQHAADDDTTGSDGFEEWEE